VWKEAILLFFISAFNLLSGYSQNNSIVFSHFDINNGISDNWIKCIFKDPKGFIWFGTNSGLNRFDGYNFEIFQHELSDSTSIADNDINVITADKDGNLWIGTGGGVSVLNCETFKFKKVNLIPLYQSSCQDINYITAMDTDTGGNILIGSHNGLFFFNQTNNSLRHIIVDGQPCSSQLNSITSIVHDKEGFWIGTNGGGLNYFNRKTGRFKRFNVQNNSICFNYINSITIDENIAWLNENGDASKPFLLPQKDPDFKIIV